jgi:hypothetical protein
LTTSSILLTAIRNVARKMAQSELADEIHQDYLVHPRKVSEQHYRILPKERDHDAYISIISGNSEPKGRMADALAYFEDRLTSMSEQSAEALRNIFNLMCQRFEFMCATLEAENAYNIFKSLNSTGVPLGAADLIRNFVFMHIPPDDHDQFERNCWRPLEARFSKAEGTLDEDRFSKFFRDYLMSEGRYVAPKDTFTSFEARYEATEFSPKELAKQLLTNSRYYAIISGEAPDENEKVTAALTGLNVLESSTTYPVLLALFQKRAAGKLNNDQLAQAVQMFRGFILRRFICGESSRGYGQMFIRALAKDESVPVATLEAYLLERGWPDDHQFETAFAAFPLYLRGYTRQVLEAIERGRGHKEPADLQAAEIEHIMPQTLSVPWKQMLGAQAERVHADYLHRPGNLTLSGYNRELWNHPFETKREYYAQSNVVMTRDLAECSTWGENEIEKRSRQLAREATNIWIGPKDPIPQVVAPEHEDNIGRRELRMQFWNGLNEYLAAEHPSVPQLEPRPGWALRLSSGIRHVGFDLRLGLRQRTVGIDVWFWRAASLPAWERIRTAPESYNALVGASWIFELAEGHERARMSLDRPAEDLRNESAWPELYKWFGDKLSLLYAEIAPKLRDEIDQANIAPVPS